LFLKFLASFITFYTSIIINNNYGLSDLGKFHYILSIQLYIITLFSFGAGNGLIFEINFRKKDRDSTIKNIINFYSVVSVFSTFISFIILKCFNSFFNIDDQIEVFLISVGIGSNVFINILIPIFYLDGKYNMAQLFSILPSLLFVISLILLEKINYSSLSLFWLYNLSTLISLILLLYNFKHIIFRGYEINVKKIFPILKYGIKFSVVNILSILQTLVILTVLKKFINNSFTEIGYFSRILAFSNLFLLFSTTFGPILFSKWSRVSNFESKLQLFTILKSITVIALLFIFFATLFGPVFLSIIFGDNFHDTEHIIFILTLNVFFTSMNSIYVNYYTSIGKLIILIKTYILMIFLTLFCAIILVPIYTSLAAAYSLLIGSIYVFIHLSIDIKKR